MTVQETVQLNFRSDNAEAMRRIRELEGEVDDLNRKTDKGSRSNMKSMAGWALAVGGVVASYVSLRSAIGFISSSVKEFTEFERAMTEVHTITDLSAEAMHGYGREVQDFAMKYGIDATETAKALYQVISAGIPQDSAMIVLGESMKFAKASLTDAAASVDLMTTVMNSYRLEAGQASAVTDTLFTTIRLGKTTGAELASTLGRVVPVAAAAGVGLTDLSASMVALTRAGLSTDEAVTSLRALLTAVVAPADGAKEAIAALGLEFFNEQALGTEGGIFRMLRELQEEGDGTVAQLAEIIPNVRGLLAALAAAGQIDDVDDILNALAESSGSVDSALTKMMGKLFFSFERISSTWDVLKSKVGEGFAALFGDDISEFADNFATFTTRLDEVAAAYQGAIESGKSGTEAMGDAWEKLKDIYEDTLGPQLREALDGASEMLEQFAADIDWGRLFAGMLVVMVKGIGEAFLILYEELALWTSDMGNMFGLWINEVGNNILDELGDAFTFSWAIFTGAARVAFDAVRGWLNDLIEKVREFFASLGDPGTSSNNLGAGGAQGGGRGARFQFGGSVMGGGGVDRVPAMLTSGEVVVREPVARDPGVAAALHALNTQGPAALHMHFPGVTSRETAMGVAPRASSGFSRFASIGGMR